MDRDLEITKKLQEILDTAINGIRRKIAGENLIAQEFFYFLTTQSFSERKMSPRTSPVKALQPSGIDPGFLLLATVRGLILAGRGSSLSGKLPGYTIPPEILSGKDSFLETLPVTDKFLLLYLPSSGTDFNYREFASALSDLIVISNKNKDLLDCFDFVDNTICIYDKEAFLLYANKSYCRHFNISNRDDAIGMHVHNLMNAQTGTHIRAKKTRSTNLKMMDVLKNGKKVLDWEIRIDADNKPGNASTILNNMYPFKDGDGNIEGLVEISSHQNLDLNQTKKILGMTTEYTFDSIIGKSAAITAAKEEAREYAVSPYNILIVGESGVGKEMFAQAIHNESPEKDGPFVAINCASLPENLIESELFGYVGGAFTGASKNGQIGKFELADGGTLFLDEVGELPLHFQAKLLRVLETRTVTRLGSTVTKSIDVRVIAATNRDLSKMIEEGFFREDLYYRLQILNIVIPPLRERKEDLLLLTDTFLANTAESGGTEPKHLSEEAKGFLIEYNWPGNVRELRNVVYRLSLLSKGEQITKTELQSAMKGQVYRLDQKKTDIQNAAKTNEHNEKDTEKEDAAKSLSPQERLDKIRAEIDSSYIKLIQEALALTGGKKQKAADLLGIDRKTLYRMMKKYFNKKDQ